MQHLCVISTRSSAVVTLQRSFQSISSQNYWQILLPPSSCSLEFTAPTSACSFFNITYSNQQLSPLTVFLSIPQTTENLPFPSILSSLDYLHLRTDTLELDSDWFIRHSHSISFFIHQHIFHRVPIFFNTWCSQCTGKKLTVIHFCQLYGAL